MFTAAILPFFLAFASLAPAAPLPLFGIHIGAGSLANGTPTSISQSQVDSSLLRPALFSRVAYCSANSVKTLTCGGPCEAINGTKILTAGGDDGAIPGFFAAQDPSTQTVVVAHQGTDPMKLMSIANDAQIHQVEMDSGLFSKVASGVLVHDGFQKTQGRTADLVLSTVTSALKSTGFKRVLTTGHSLGAAVATLDALMLRMQLPSDVEVDSVVFGLPRVGNQEFANMIDAMLPGFTRVTNQDDPVPNVPPRLLSYQHAQGEVHIKSVDSNGTANLVECPGQENENCSQGNSLLESSIPNHLGPYFDNISFGASACSA